jgi:hypothetical protein
MCDLETGEPNLRFDETKFQNELKTLSPTNGELESKSEDYRKVEIVSKFMDERSKAQLNDKMIALGLDKLDMTVIGRLPISDKSKMALIDQLIIQRVGCE